MTDLMVVLILLLSAAVLFGLVWLCEALRPS